MGERKGTQGIPINTLRVDAFSGGMNTSGSARDIAPNECSLLENFEFDDLDNLVTRDGIRVTFPAVVGFSYGLFSFNTDSGFVGILATPGTALNSYDLSGNITVITGGLGLPSNAKWYWKSLNNVAVGVNGATGAGNPVQVVGPAPGTASHLAAAPDGRYIEEWGSRLWIVHVSSPSRVQCSDLGSATAWNTDGLTNPAHGITVDVAPGDGDVITALFAWKERLFIFKKKRIYVLRIVSSPPTDPNSWEVVEYSKLLGCVNQSTVREAFDDVVFLSEGGLASLSAAELVADFSSAIISVKISEIQRIKKDAPETAITAYALADRSQYWLAVDGSASPTGSDIVWVMDYKQIRTKGIRWTVFTGGMFPIAIELYNGTGQTQQTYLLFIKAGTPITGGSVTLYRPNTPVGDRQFRDVVAALVIQPIICRIYTKAFDFDLDDILKDFLQWYLRYDALTNKTHFKVSYEMDDPLSPIVNYDWDAYGLTHNKKENLVRAAFQHGVQRKSVSVRFLMTIGGAINQGASIKNFGIQYAILNERRSESMTITNTIKNVPFAIDRNRTILGNVGIGQDLVYNFLLPFDSLKTDGDYIDVLAGGGLANNNNDKSIILQIEGNAGSGAGGDFVTGVSPVDLDGAAGTDSWTLYARIMRISATQVLATGRAVIGQLFADGAGVFSSTNGLVKGDNRLITVANLNLNDLTVQIIAEGVADNDVVHRGTVILLNQQ